MQKVLKELSDTLHIIMGDKPLSYYLAGFFFSFLAILLSLYQHSRKRDVCSPQTPQRFSWYFLLWDNTKRLGTGMIVMFLLFRAFDLSSLWGMIGVGFFVAFGLDKAIQFLMEKSNILNILKMNRDDVPAKPDQP